MKEETVMVTVKKAETKNEIRAFVNFPNKLYKGNKNFVPATYGDDLEDWDRKKNPAFEYCDAEPFLAYKDGKIVGRIAVILSRKANEKWNTKRCRFSQVDFIDDEEVSQALFKTAEDFAKKKGCDEIHGPLGFTDLDREGMLISGFDRPNQFFTYYNNQYYIKHLERLGYVKDVDWIEYKLFVPEKESKQAEKLDKVSNYILKKKNLHIANVTKPSEYKFYVEKVFRLLNEAYAPLYGVVELSERQIKKYRDKFAPLVNPDYSCFVLDENDELVSFGVGAPSIAKALQKSNGRLFPFGWVGVLRAFRKNNALDLLLVAVKPEYQGLGVNAILMNKFLQSALKNGLEYAETGPMLETNEKILSQWDMFEKQLIKRRRCFIKKLK